MSKKWLVPSIGFILILPLISFYYMTSTPPTMNKPRRVLRNINELRDYMHPADSPQYQYYIQIHSPQPKPRRLQINSCLACAPFFHCSCVHTTCGGPPCTTTAPPSLPPTPGRNDLPGIDDTGNTPYIFVNFDNHISQASANFFCQNTIGDGSILASVNKSDERNTQQEQVAIMTNLTLTHAENGDSCWIGLKYDNNTNQWQWGNGIYLDQSTDYTYWLDAASPGPFTPTWCTLMAFQTGATVQEYKWDNVDCVSGAAEFITHCALCTNPKYIPYNTAAPTRTPTRIPTRY
eukprot:320006_1